MLALGLLAGRHSRFVADSGSAAPLQSVSVHKLGWTPLDTGAPGAPSPRNRRRRDVPGYRHDWPLQNNLLARNRLLPPGPAVAVLVPTVQCQYRKMLVMTSVYLYSISVLVSLSACAPF